MSADTGNTNVAPGEHMIVLDLRDEYDLFDRLPPAIRAYLNDAPVKWSAVNLAEIFAEDLAGGVFAAIPAMMRNAEALERESFNDHHRALYGCDLPHVLAGVPALRAAPADSWAPIR